MTAPRRPAEQATMRGAIVLFVAVVVGLALLSKGGGLVGSAEAGSAAPKQTTTTTTKPAVTKTTVAPINPGTGSTAKPHKPAEVKVIVINAAHKSGIGSANTNKAKDAGYVTLPVKNFDAGSDTTGIFFAKGYDADAAAVKTALGLATAPVQAAPAQPIIAEAAEANVIVVLGKNYQG